MTAVAINADRDQLAKLGEQMIRASTAPRASDLIETEDTAPSDGGWKSRKFVTVVAVVGAIMVTAVVGGLVLGQYDAALIWHGRLSEPGAIHLVELAVITACSYLGINFVGKVADVAGQIFGARNK